MGLPNALQIMYWFILQVKIFDAFALNTPHSGTRMRSFFPTLRP